MGPAKRTIAIVALTTTLVGCSNHVSQMTIPATYAEPIKIYTTTTTYPLVGDATIAYAETNTLQNLEIYSSTYQFMVDRFRMKDDSYVISTHLPSDDSLWAAPIGQDGLVIIVNPNNQIENLTIEQLHLIYRGQILNWKELGGIRQEIVVFDREHGSDIGLEFSRLVMGYHQVTSTAHLVTSNQQMVEQVSQSIGGIGYVSLAHMTDDAKALMLDNIVPSYDTVFQNTYPLRSIIYVVGINEPYRAYHSFIAWLQGPEGQNVIAQRFAKLSTVSQQNDIE